MLSRKQTNRQISMPIAANFKRISSISLPKGLLGHRNGCDSSLTSVLASWRDFGDIRRLPYSEPLRQAQLSD